MTNNNTAKTIDPKYVELIVLAYEYELSHEMDPAKGTTGWEWRQALIPPASISKMILLGLVKQTYSSNSCKEYRLTDLGIVIANEELDRRKKQEQASELIEEDSQDLDAETINNLFDDIVGYDNIKELFKESLQLPKPIHILLAGPPSVAKTMFLSDVERVTGLQSLWMLGSGASKAGIWNAIIDARPKYILIDELDKMAAVDYAALLSLMEKGRITRTKVGKQTDLKLTVWVFASANDIDNVPPALMSRFSVKHLKEYNAIEYMNVVRATLIRHENISEEDATKIAAELAGKSYDVRDAVRVARLSSRVGVEKALDLLIR